MLDIAFQAVSEQQGVSWGHEPSNHAAVVPRNGGGGRFRILGDYLWRDKTSFHFDGGIWGIFRIAILAG